MIPKHATVSPYLGGHEMTMKEQQQKCNVEKRTVQKIARHLGTKNAVDTCTRMECHGEREKVKNYTVVLQVKFRGKTN